MFLACLKRAIAQDNGEKLRMAVDGLLELAALHEPWAIKELADRLDGRPNQQIQAVDEEGRSIAVALIAYSDSLQLQSQNLPAPNPESTGLRH